MKKKVIRVLLAEDSKTQRELLVSLLDSDPEVEVIGEACDGEQAVEKAVLLRPDVIVMDVGMPRLNGLEATQRIMVEAPVPIVLVSQVNKEVVKLAMDTLSAGALTVLQKPPDPGAGFCKNCRRVCLNHQSLSSKSSAPSSPIA